MNIEGSASDGARDRGNCELLDTDCVDCARRAGGRDASGEVFFIRDGKPNLVEAGGVGRIAISARGGGYV